MESAGVPDLREQLADPADTRGLRPPVAALAQWLGKWSDREMDAVRRAAAALDRALSDR
jgi:hypothetical protein